jgi:hypothetical protein
VSFIHAQKRLTTTSTILLIFPGTIFNFKLFFRSVGFTNFGRETEEIRHFVFSEVS